MKEAILIFAISAGVLFIANGIATASRYLTLVCVKVAAQSVSLDRALEQCK